MSHIAKFGWWVTFAVRNAWQRSKTQKLRTASENTGPILNRLWTKFTKFSDDDDDDDDDEIAYFSRCRRCKSPFVLSGALSRLVMSRFVQMIFAIKSRSRRKTEQM